MEIEILRPRLMAPELAERWTGLQESDPALRSPFLTPHWPKAVERALEHPDRGLRIAVLHEGGKPRGFLGVRADAFAAMPPGAPMCDYQALVAEPGLRLDPRALVRALAVGRLDFSHMLAGRDGFARFAKGREVSWTVDVEAGYKAYAAGRRKAGLTVLKDLDKKRRKVEREVGPVRFTARSASREDFESLFDWKRAQLKGTGQVDIFAGGWPMRLMRDLFQRQQPGLEGVLFTLHVGHGLAAVQFHLAGTRVLHAWVIAHDAAFERYSPGMLLFQDILRWMDATPFVRLDLGVGDYRFKRELANGTVEVMHGFVGVRSRAALLRGAAYGVRRAAEFLPLGAVSDLPGKAMRRFDVLRALR
ncbi:MAG: GNAT family N-acetyltransferase [Caulobacteraceae bacterium]